MSDPAVVVVRNITATDTDGAIIKAHVEEPRGGKVVSFEQSTGVVWLPRQQALEFISRIADMIAAEMPEEG